MLDWNRRHGSRGSNHRGNGKRGRRGHLRSTVIKALAHVVAIGGHVALQYAQVGDQRRSRPSEFVAPKRDAEAKRRRAQHDRGSGTERAQALIHRDKAKTIRAARSVDVVVASASQNKNVGISQLELAQNTEEMPSTKGRRAAVVREPSVEGHIGRQGGEIQNSG
eukprot:SAG31_NODE_16572_length_703_cov_7.665563_1_plen_164_part_01